jgi:hypothetical protein
VLAAPELRRIMKLTHSRHQIDLLHLNQWKGAARLLAESYKCGRYVSY